MGSPSNAETGTQISFFIFPPTSTELKFQDIKKNSVVAQKSKHQKPAWPGMGGLGAGPPPLSCPASTPPKHKARATFPTFLSW